MQGRVRPALGRVEAGAPRSLRGGVGRRGRTAAAMPMHLREMRICGDMCMCVQGRREKDKDEKASRSHAPARETTFHALISQPILVCLHTKESHVSLSKKLVAQKCRPRHLRIGRCEGMQ
jgi:hypothetical protein